MLNAKPISGTLDPDNLRATLTELLAQRGLTFEVRCEVILVK